MLRTLTEAQRQLPSVFWSRCVKMAFGLMPWLSRPPMPPAVQNGGVWQTRRSCARNCESTASRRRFLGRLALGDRRLEVSMRKQMQSPRRQRQGPSQLHRKGESCHVHRQQNVMAPPRSPLSRAGTCGQRHWRFSDPFKSRDSVWIPSPSTRLWQPVNEVARHATPLHYFRRFDKLTHLRLGLLIW